MAAAAGAAAGVRREQPDRAAFGTFGPFDRPRARVYAPRARRRASEPCGGGRSRLPTSPGGGAGTESRAKEVIPALAEIRVGENETFESALRRFNKKIQQSGILAEARRREHYEKPSVKRKRKEAKRKKATRQQG